MDAPRSNSPSRRSRFRSQSGAPYRSTAPAEETVPGTDEEAAVGVEEEIFAEGAPTGTDTMEPPAAAAVPGEYYPIDAPAAEGPPAEDSLPVGLRLTRSPEGMTVQRRGIPGWAAGLVAASCLGLGGVAGYLLHSNAVASAKTATSARVTAERTAPVIPLAPAVLGDVDAAFSANKQGQYADARQRFDVLADRHPNWPSMRIEAARATMYEHDFEAAAKILNTVQRAGSSVDAQLLTALIQMTTQTYDKAEADFAQATALDPARPDVFYFWGECLRREGKPQEAADKFREALTRNQYETAQGLYQLKLWLSEIQSDQETAKNTNAVIDAEMASGHPSGPAYFAASAREIKAGQFREAGAHIGQAQKVMEPAVFRVVLQDPTFLEQNFRPEIAPYYQP